MRSYVVGCYIKINFYFFSCCYLWFDQFIFFYSVFKFEFLDLIYRFLGVIRFFQGIYGVKIKQDLVRIKIWY